MGNPHKDKILVELWLEESDLNIVKKMIEVTKDLIDSGKITDDDYDMNTAIIGNIVYEALAEETK